MPPEAVVIGGGAAGFFAAIACAEAGAAVTLLEAGRQVLSKVRISGGGRCNVTHACFDPALLVQQYPRGGKALRGAFSRFQPRDTIAWFEQRGVRLKTEADGRMFPVSDNSGTIVECLVQAAQRAGVRVRIGSAVAQATRDGAGFVIGLATAETLWADRILLATGSSPQGFRLARSLGHATEPPVPSLFTFALQDPRLSDLAGVSVPLAQLQLLTDPALEQVGPLLITHWGLSGPAVLKLSAWGARSLQARRYRADLRVNWLPDVPGEALPKTLHQIRHDLARRAIAAHSPFEALPQRLWRRLVEAARIPAEQRWAELSKVQTQALARELGHGSFAIQGKGAFKEEFVTCGGVTLKEVDFRTMQSRLCPGLYLAGEVLDIDGVTGGFNFQSAWTTGWLAGQAMARPDP